MSPRSNRDDSSVNLYNVLICSNNNESIFRDEFDCEFMKELILNNSSDATYKVYAYCILPDRANFLISPSGESLSASMKRINMTYAMYYNRKYLRSGHVFHDRYRSRPVDKDCVIAVIRSIHDMPVLEGYTQDRESFRFSSYRLYKNIARTAEYVEIEGILCSTEEILKNGNEYEYIDKCFSDVGKIACKLINEFYGKHNINESILKNKESEPFRRELVILIRTNTGFSIRKISELLNINRGEVYKFISLIEEDKNDMPDM